MLQMATDDEPQDSNPEIPASPAPWFCRHGDDNGHEHLRNAPRELQVERWLPSLRNDACDTNMRVHAHNSYTNAKHRKQDETDRSHGCEPESH